MIRININNIAIIVILLRFTFSKFVFESLDHLKLNPVNNVIKKSDKNSKQVIKTDINDTINNDSPFVFWPADKNVKSRVKVQTSTPKNILNNLDPDRILYTVDSLGNPFKTPEKCVKINSDLIYLCDPDNILSQHEQLNINYKLLQLPSKNYHYCSDGRQYGLKIAMLLVNNILQPFPKSLDDAAQWLCNELIDKWKIGNEGCNDGILVLYIKNSNAIFIAIKDGNEDILSMEKITNIEDTFTNSIKTKSDYESLIELIDNLSDSLPKKTQGIQWSIIIPCSIGVIYLVVVGAVYWTRLT